MPQTLKSKAIQGVFWTFVEAFGARLVQFTVGIILARLLLPEQFGLIGMLLIFMAVAQVFLDSGFGSGLIQKKDASQEDICTVFYFNIALGVITALTLCLAAPAIAMFYNQPVLTQLMRVLSLAIVINSFGLIQNTMMRKQINFRVITIAVLVAAGLSGAIGITMAYLGYGVWSLAVQQVSNAFFRTTMLWLISSWRPALVFRFQALKEMFGFSSRLMATALLNQTFNNIYLLAIGKLFSAGQLGLYTRAQNFQDLPAQSLSRVVAKVSFPVFSAIQEDKGRLKRGLKKALISLVLVNFPMMIGLAVVAHPLILALLTEKWIECVPYLQVLCLSGLMYPLHQMNINVLQALGRSDLILKLEVIKKSLIVLNIAVTWRWGIMAMISGHVGISVVSYYLNTYYNGKLIDYPMGEQLRDMAAYLLAAVVMGLAVFTLGLIPFSNSLVQLASQIVMGVGIYFGICRLFSLPEFMEFYKAGLNKIGKIRAASG